MVQPWKRKDNGGEGGTNEKKGEQIEQTRTVEKDEDPYAPTPPKIPASKEERLTRPPLVPPSSPLPPPPEGSLDVPPSPTSSPFTDAELSLLKDWGITEVTPGRWMRTAEQTDGRIMLTCARDNGIIYLNSKVRTTTE